MQSITLLVCVIFNLAIILSLTLDVLTRLGKPINAATAADLFVEMAVETKAYADLTHRSLGPKGRATADRAQAQASA